MAREMVSLGERIDIFIEMELNWKAARQAKQELYSQLSHEGPAPARLLSSIDYEK
jgi:hypothetical protein